MRGEWCYFKSHFDKETCAKILSDASSIPVQDAMLGTGAGTYSNTGYRRSKIKFINSSDKRFAYLFDALWKMAIQANNDFFGLHLSKLDYVQLAEYDSAYEGEYKDHHDVFWMNGDPNYHRKLTCVVQLSDPLDYEGGNLELTEVGELPPAEEIRQQGTAIFFPSLFRHRATAVTKGTRYSIAAWFDGPKWR